MFESNTSNLKEFILCN